MIDSIWTFKNSLRSNLKVFKESIWILGIHYFIILIIIGLILYKNNSFDYTLFKYFFIPSLFFVLPAIYLQVEYLIYNYNKILEIDLENEIIKITKGKKKFKYNFNDVDISRIYRSFYYMRKKSDIGTRKFSTSDYGYWTIRFNDGKQFSFTSLMIDTTESHILKETEIIYRYFCTNIVRSELSDKESCKLEKHNFEEIVDLYIDKYKKLKKTELDFILNNRKSYQIEAIEACQRLVNNAYSC